MKIEEIKELIRLVNETGIAELEVRRGDDTVRIRRSTGGNDQQVVLPTVVPVSVGTTATLAPSIAPSAPLITSASRGAEPVSQEDERSLTVKSPIVGTYYDAPSPGAAPFVKVGDVVHPKQVLCIIESMKLMNEIESEYAGTIAAKLVENGRPVEYGEALFSIRPS